MRPGAGTGEWPAAADVEAALAAGFRPRPFRQFVVKLSSRCDLACDYCYVYQMADQSWRDRPAMISRPVVDRVADRIAEHVAGHQLDSIEVVLHGGEPLLAGAELIGYAARAVRRRLPGDVSAALAVQTNGVRLDAMVLEVLAAERIQVGVSVDGDGAAHDRHRRHADGRPSYPAVRAGLRLLTDRHPELFRGLLCTIDLANAPVPTYEALLEFAPPAVDLLLPHGHWSAPPPGRRPGDPATPYGDWLVAAFDRWYGAPRRETRVRYFEELINLLLGGASRVETIGLSPPAVVVVDTDGTVEQVDTLRSVYHGAARTGLDVFRHPFDAALLHPGVVARQLGTAALSATCQSCGVRRICGGGYYPHRYRRGAGFRNPSVYCRDLQRLIRHVHQRLATDLDRRSGTTPAC